MCDVINPLISRCACVGLYIHVVALPLYSLFGYSVYHISKIDLNNKNDNLIVRTGKKARHETSARMTRERM